MQPLQMLAIPPLSHPHPDPLCFDPSLRPPMLIETEHDLLLSGQAFK